MRPVTIYMASAAYRNAGLPHGVRVGAGWPVDTRFRVTVEMWPSTVTSMRGYYRYLRRSWCLDHPMARLVCVAQYAVRWNP